MRKIFGLLTTFLLLFKASHCHSQNTSLQYAETIKADDLREHLSIIASDSFQGRNTGELGQKLAAAYIADQFKKNGLSAPVAAGDSLSYFQKFVVFKKSWDNPYLIVNKKEKSFYSDFFSLANPDIVEEEELDVVFGGFGLENFMNQKQDVKGKAVVLFQEKIADSLNAFNNILASNFNRNYSNILNNGARALLIITTNDSIYQSFLRSYKCDLEETEIYIKPKQYIFNNTFFISPLLASEILGIELKELKKLQLKSEAYSSGDLKSLKPKKIKIKASRKIETIETENVLGFIEGSDKKDEVLVITAHYDHEGIKCGEIYNGADDDGSGTSTVIELAQAFALAKKENNGPRRSILFMTVTGEEKGLLGSQYYTQNPVFPLSQTIADLNIDMIGRIDKFHTNDNYVYLIGSNRLSSDLHRISEETNTKYIHFNLDYKYNAVDDPNHFYYRSDHYNFAKNNIPVIFYFSGVHEDYHKPTDDIEKILFNKVEKTGRLIFHTAWELVNREERIKVDEKK